MAQLKEKEMDLDDEMTEGMLGEAKFTNRIVLPAKAKKLTGETLKHVTGNEYVQTGTLLDMYRTPEKFAYSVEY